VQKLVVEERPMDLAAGRRAPDRESIRRGAAAPRRFLTRSHGSRYDRGSRSDAFPRRKEERMERRTVLLAAAVALALTSVGAPRAFAQGACVTNFRPDYECAFRREDGFTFNFCLDFSVGGFGDFDAVFDGNLPFGCDCKPSGTFEDPRFDSGKFHCATPSDVGVGIALLGRAFSDGGVRGSTAAENGVTGLFVCGGPCQAGQRIGDPDVLEMLTGSTAR
jgi:hypothetical protein